MKLLDVIAKARSSTRVDLADLTVLSAAADPYRVCTGKEAAWFAEQMERFADHRRIHLRGLHYRVVAAADVKRPDGRPYTNTDENWTWLCRAAKAARRLKLVPFEAIADERNAAPEIFVPAAEEIWWRVSAWSLSSQPDLPDVLPGFVCNSVVAEQPFRMVFVGEKTSLAEILRPIAELTGAEMCLPTGEMSDTMASEIAEHAASDDRPTVVFYLSDFDPAGRQMPVSVSRKLQAFRDLY